MKVNHWASFKQWSVLKNSGVTSEKGGGNKMQVPMSSVNLSALCPQSQRLE